ncbi:MAG: ATPase, T2SS/T4P/T4SS family [bacterium]
MKLKPEELKKLLVGNNVITADKFDEIAKLATQNNENILDLLGQKKVINEREFARICAKELNVPYIDLSKEAVTREALEKLPERVARRYQAAVFGEENGQTKVAMSDPDNVESVQFIEKQLGYDIKIYLATLSDIGGVLELYREGLSTEISKAIKETEDEISVEKEELEKDASSDHVEAIITEAPISRAVNILIEYAIKSRASDIHIEPRESFVQVRYRVDGILKDTMTLPRALMSSIISRIKILANLRIDEHRIPQDGRIKIKLAGRSISIRVSTLPVMDGEKIVMRLLDETSKALTLEDLGFQGQSIIIIKKALDRPHGMLLVTGPTGSGKSTTLYSVVSALNGIGVNISTIEDPVEYRIAGVNQTQVNTKVGMTFASGLRALLRQDPNIIMVGEIRDSETAEIAVHSALTGHVVLSTLHTNNAAGCLPRLLDMNIEPFLISSTVNAVIGQRLVRKICPHCSESYSPDPEVTEEISRDFNLRRETFASKDKSLFKIERTKDTDMEIKLRDKIFDIKAERQNKSAKKPIHLTFHQGKGCNKCDNSGYLGRVGIYEVIDVDDDVGKLIISHASTTEIQDLAVSKGMISMQQDGFLKALEGITTFEEVLRVTRE